MVKIEEKLLRFMTDEQFRVLVGIELGMRNHQVVPTPLIQKIARLRKTGFSTILSDLLKMKLIHHENKVCKCEILFLQLVDGYWLTYKGYDFLALRTFLKRGVLVGLGRQIGIGKEADVYTCYDNDMGEMVIKLERLGRTSFRQVKKKRGYLGKKSCGNWLYLSRIAASLEYEIMKVLYEHKFPVPVPLSHNRHCVLMSLVPGVTLNQVQKVAREGDAEKLYQKCLDLVIRFAEYGLIHCDFNEFNLMVELETQELIVIDFPQMVSRDHLNAEELFQRDFECVHTFFSRRFGCERIVSERDTLEKIEIIKDLDVELKASGFDLDKHKEFKSKIRKEKKRVKAEMGDEEKEKKEIDEDRKIRETIKIKVEREKTKKKFIKQAKKKARKGKNKRMYWNKNI